MPCPSNHWNNGEDVCADCGEDLNPPPEKPTAPFCTVAVYLVDRAYGGSEEGGWWYTCGTRVDSAAEVDIPAQDLFGVYYDGAHSAERLAEMAAKRVQELLDAGINVGRREIGSVLSTGRYEACVYNGHPPHHFPETRPHYE